MNTEIYDQYTVTDAGTAFESGGEEIYAVEDVDEVELRGYLRYSFDAETGLFSPVGLRVRRPLTAEDPASLCYVLYSEFGSTMWGARAYVLNGRVRKETLRFRAVSAGNKRGAGAFVRRFAAPAGAYPEGGELEGYWYEHVGACDHPFGLYAVKGGELKSVRQVYVPRGDGAVQTLLGATAGKGE